MKRTIRIGTRGSLLARWQANFVADRLRERGQSVELVILRTQGDQTVDRPLAEIGGEGLFTKAIQEALLRGEVDVAVHSLKDLPTGAVPGLQLVAVPTRADPYDALISTRHQNFASLPHQAIVATGSQRRSAMLRHRRPDLRLVPLRGNIDTRLKKLHEEGWDGLIMAKAALDRLNLTDYMTEILDPSWMVPAVGQGALGLECRSDDVATRNIVALLNDEKSFTAVIAERALLEALGGGCSVPIGARGWVEGSLLHLHAVVLDAAGRRRIEGEATGSATEPVDLGKRLAATLCGAGAGDLLDSEKFDKG